MTIAIDAARLLGRLTELGRTGRDEAGRLSRLAGTDADRAGRDLLSDWMRAAGLRVPEDVAVAGYDDSMLARMQHLDLTSVSQEPDETARHAVDLAVAGPQTEPRDEGVGRQIVVTPRLVVRSSTRGARSD